MVGFAPACLNGMPPMSGAELRERLVAGKIPLVARAQAALDRRRIGARRADGAERVGDAARTGVEIPVPQSCVIGLPKLGRPDCC